MLRRPLLAFSFIVGTLIFGALWFIQSPQFAKIVKEVVSTHLPRDLGIEGDFKEFSVQLFPPAVSVKEPKVWIKARNPLGLPAGSSVQAARIDFRFLPLQILSGDIWVHEVAILQGKFKLFLGNPALQTRSLGDKKKFSLNWDELFQVHAESISLKDTQLELEFLGEDSKTQKTMRATAYQLKVAQKSSKGGLGYALQLDVGQLEGSYLKDLSLPDQIDRVSGLAFLNPRGLKIDELLFTKRGVALSTRGEIKGDLVNLENGVDAEVQFKLQGELSSIVQILGVNSLEKSPSVQGVVDIDGNLNGNLAHPEDQLQLMGKLNVRDFSFMGWSGDLLQIDAGWKSAPGGGEVSFNQGLIFAGLKDRVLGEKVAHGGRIEIGKFNWKFKSKNPILVPLKIDHAHIHWLVGESASSIYPLDFRINGETDVSFTPPSAQQSWRLHASLKNWVEDFQLDNQKLGQKKPLRKIFDIPRINLNGTVTVDQKGVYPKDLQLKIAQTELNLKGKIDFKTGLDLFAQGSLRLDDLGEIAEIPSRGMGPAQVFVHGPFSSVLVDVDVDLKEAFYVNLFLGALKGRITWDDDKNFLYIRQAKLQADETLYSVDGHLDLGRNEKIELDATISQGNLKNISQITQNLTDQAQFFQDTLYGPVQGDVKIRGGLGAHDLKVLVDLHGKNWEYMKERFRTAKLTGGYDQGRLFADSFNFEKRDGSIQGRFSYDLNKKVYSWKVNTQNLDLSEFDALARLNVPVRSKIDFQSSGQGELESLEASAELSLRDTYFHGKSTPSSYISMSSGNGEVSLHGVVFGGQALVDGSYNWDDKLPSVLQLELKHFDFSPAFLFFNKSLVQDPEFAARLTGGASLKVFPHQDGLAHGSFSLSELILSKKNLKLELDEPIKATIQEGNFKIPHFVLKSKEGNLEGRLENSKVGVRGELSGTAENAVVQFFTGAISQINGVSSLQFALSGRHQQPKATGRVNLRIGQVVLDSFDSSFENISGEIQLKENQWFMNRISSELGGGRLNLDGTLTQLSHQKTEVSIHGALKDARIKVAPFQYVKLSGGVHLHGSEAPYALDGRLIVHSALSREKMLSSKKGSDTSKTIQQLPLPSEQGGTQKSMVSLNLDVEAPQGIYFQNDLFRDLQARAKLKLTNTVDAPRILGKAEVIQGKLVFKDHVFQVRSGSAVFDSLTSSNPSFDLVASTEVNNIKIQLFASGKKNDIRVELSSNPPMPESDLFALLALGVTSADAKKLDAASLTAIQQGEAASLLFHSLDVSRDIEEKTGFQVGLDEAVNRQQGVSAFRMQGDVAAAPQIKIRRRLGKRLSVSAGTTVGIGTSKANQFTIDYSVNPDLSVIGVYNNFTSYSTGDIQPYPTSVGLDLKFLKRFK